MADTTTFVIALPALGTAIGGVILALNGRKEIKAKADMNYVTLTREATDLLLERMNELRNDHIQLKIDHARCHRNIQKLRDALVTAGVDVPELE